MKRKIYSSIDAIVADIPDGARQRIPEMSFA